MKKLSKILIVVLALALVIGAIAVVASADDVKAAKIGDTEYETLEAAFGAAKDGDVITVQKDATFSSNLSVVGTDAENPKTVTLDLAGHSVDAAKIGVKFNVGAYGTLKIKGSGSIGTAGTSLFVSEIASATVIVGEEGSTDRIRIHDDAAYAGPSEQRYSLTQTRTGTFEGYNVDFSYKRGSDGCVFDLQNGNNVMKLVNCTLDMPSPGNSWFASWETTSAMKFEAIGCVFNQVTTAKDTEASDFGKSQALKLPSSEPAEGSYIRFVDSKINFKWRLVNGAIIFNMPVEFKNCELVMGCADFVPADRCFARVARVSYEDCKFDDTYCGTGNWGYNGDGQGKNPAVATYIGENQFKYNILNPTPAANIILPDGAKMVLVKDASDGYPYHLTAREVSDEEASSILVYRRTFFNSETISGSNFGSLINAFHKDGGTGTMLSGATGATTPYRINRYFKFYANATMNPIPKVGNGGIADCYFNILGSDSYNDRVKLEDYGYYFLDFDIATETQYPHFLNFAMICRNKDGGSFPLSNRDIAYLKVNDNGEAYFESRIGGGNVSLGSDPFEWHHITLAYQLGDTTLSADGTYSYLTGDTKMFFFVDGVRVNPTAAVLKATTDECVLFGNNFRLQYLEGYTVIHEGDSIILDNVMVSAYERGNSAAVDPLFADTSLTLQKANYFGYNDSYVMPEAAPVASVNGFCFDTLKEAYDYAVANKAEELVLLHKTSEKVDIQANLTIDTNGIDWVPTDNSWGFSRDGQKFVFSTKLNEGAGVYWYSNPFDPDYAYEQSVKGGRYIAHPAADANNAALKTYSVKDENGNYTFYRFLGWSESADSTELVTSFPIITSENVYDTFNYFAVYEEFTPLYMTGEKEVTVLYSGEAFGDPDVPKTMVVANAGGDLTELRAYVQAAGVKTVKLLADIEVTNDVGTLFNVKGTLNLDLNGHKIVYVITQNGKSIQPVLTASNGATINVTSSQPGAVVEGRSIWLDSTDKNQIVNASTGVFFVDNNGKLTVDGGETMNILVRGGDILETRSNVNVTFKHTTLQVVCQDSWASMMIRSNNATVNLDHILYVNTIQNYTYGVSGFNVVDIGDGASSVSNVVVNATDSHFLWAFHNDGGAVWFANRFPTGAKVTMTNCIGNYNPGSAGAIKGGEFLLGAGNNFTNEVGTTGGYQGVKLADGVILAKTWGINFKNLDITVQYPELYPNGLPVSHIHIDHTGYIAYEDYAEQSYFKVAADKCRWGTFTAETSRKCIWTETTDTGSKVLATIVWDKRVSDAFYNNAVPSYTDKDGVSYSYPNDQWAKYFTAEDGTEYWAPNPKKATVTAIAEQTFKQNVVLTSELAMNLFVKKLAADTALTTTVTVDGVVLPATERVINGETYLVYRVAVNADEAANDIAFVVTYKLGNEFVQTAVTSIANYAAALATVEEGAYADLANAMLRYAKASYLYTAEEGATVPAALNIADAESHAAFGEAVYKTSESDVLDAIYLDLGAKPVVVFAVKAGFEGEITLAYQGQSGRDYKIVKEVEKSEEVTRLTLDSLKLVDFDQTISVYANGEFVVSINLAAAYAMNAEDAARASVIAALNDYIAAARAYLK